MNMRVLKAIAHIWLFAAYSTAIVIAAAVRGTQP